LIKQQHYFTIAEHSLSHARVIPGCLDSAVFKWNMHKQRQNDDFCVCSLIPDREAVLLLNMAKDECRKSSFNAASYAAFRPSYPPSLYSTVLRFHHGQKSLLVDLGCGTGVVPRYMSQEFKHVIGIDPSSGMIKKAEDLSPNNQYSNVDYQVASAESLPFLEDESADMVVAAQAAHWFDYPKLFPELKRVLRKHGTIGFWGYKDHVYCGYPAASKIMLEYCYGPDPSRQLGPFWEPGRLIIANKLRPIKPPEVDFEDIQRTEYEPDARGRGMGQGTLFMEKEMTISQSMEYIRTFSSFHEWEKKNPDRIARAKGGDGDLVDWMYDDMKEAEGWTSEDMLVDLEWGSALILCRKR
jgi:SAM-dependent methyltransferase